MASLYTGHPFQGFGCNSHLLINKSNHAQTQSELRGSVESQGGTHVVPNPKFLEMVCSPSYSPLSSFEGSEQGEGYFSNQKIVLDGHSFTSRPEWLRLLDSGLGFSEQGGCSQGLPQDASPGFILDRASFKLLPLIATVGDYLDVLVKQRDYESSESSHSFFSGSDSGPLSSRGGSYGDGCSCGCPVEEEAQQGSGCLSYSDRVVCSRLTALSSESGTNSKTSQNFTSGEMLPENLKGEGQLFKVQDAGLLPFIDYLENRYSHALDTPLLDFETGSTNRLGEYVIRVRDRGHRWFRFYSEVFCRGERLGVLCWGSTARNVSEASFKVDNRWLYQSSDLAADLKEFATLFKLSYKHTTRLDLAIDGVDISPLLSGHFAGLYEKKGQGAITAVYRKRSFEGFAVGRRGYRRLNWYNKTVELKRSNKTYISGIHEKHGFVGDVHRLEVQLSWAYLQTVEGFDLWSLLEDGEQYLQLFATATKNYFDFVEAGDTNKTRAKTVFSFDRVVGFVVERMARVYDRVTDGIHAAKVTLRKLFFVGAEYGGNAVRPAIAEILRTHPLLNWWQKKIPQWGEEVTSDLLCYNRTAHADFILHPL